MTTEQQVQLTIRDKWRQGLLESLQSLGDYGQELTRLLEDAWAVADSGAFKPSKPTYEELLQEALAEGARRGEERKARAQA